ncbi:MAG: gliding motility-associated C-terminal domain-containing protein [Flavobacteriales bacterium]|nr:gliding motility-associated C-terminal domain-containing protein [Flavobacteriales bacterium]
MNSLYLWQDNSTSPTFTVTQPGTYWVQLTNSCGTTGDTVEVIPGALPTVELGNDTLLCAGDSLTLNAANTNSAYLWQDNSTNPTLDVTQPGTYWVGVTNICGVKPDTISVMWQNCDCYLHVPNAFTPNGDNINDGFLPIPHCNFATYKLCIYNRWGDLIFQSSDYRISWNGMTNNGTKQSQQDVYVWVIDAVDEKGQAHQYLGHVTLVR